MQAPSWLKRTAAGSTAKAGGRPTTKARGAYPPGGGGSAGGANAPAGKGSGRRRGKGKRRAPELNEVQAVLPKLVETTLNAMQRIRELEATVTDVALIPSKTELAKRCLQYGKDYSAGVEEAGRKNHELGAPHLYIWGEVVTWLCQQEGIGQLNKSFFTDYGASEAFQSADLVADDVRIYRCVRCWQEEGAAEEEGQCKIIVSIPNNARLRETLRASIKQLGGVWQQGRAPANAQERVMQTWLDKLSS